MSIEDKYPGLFRALEPIAKASVKELFSGSQCGACYGGEGNTGKKIVFCFDAETVAIIDGFHVLPLKISSLGNRRLADGEGKSVLGFTFDHREYTMRGLTADDLKMLGPRFLGPDESDDDLSSEDSTRKSSVVLATTPYVHGYEVKKVHGLIYATADSVDIALNLLREYALDCDSNAVVGILVAQANSVRQIETDGVQMIVYGTAMKLSKPSN